MPLDVLNELEQAKQSIGSDNEQLAQSLDKVIEKAKQSSESMNALRGIVQGLTADGRGLSGSLEKVVAYFDKFEKTTNDVKTGTYGLTSAYADLGQVAPDALIKVQQQLQQITVMQKQLSHGIHFSAIDDVQVLTRQVQRLKNTLRNMPKIPVERGSYAGKYATGGRVPGSSYSGDKVPILVNSGEYILNQAQMRRLGNRLGGKSPSQVFQFASGRNNIRGRISGGYQAFTQGGIVDVVKALSQNPLIDSYVQKSWASLYKVMKASSEKLQDLETIVQTQLTNQNVTKLEDLKKSDIDDISRQISIRNRDAIINKHQNQNQNPTTSPMATTKQYLNIQKEIASSTAGNIRDTAKEKVSATKGVMSNLKYLNKSNRGQSIFTKALNETLTTTGYTTLKDLLGRGTVGEIEKFNQLLEEGTDKLKNFETEVKDLGGVIDNVTNQAEENAKKIYAQLGGIPKSLSMIGVAMTMYVLKQLDTLKQKVQDFIRNNAQLNKELAITQSTVKNLFADSNIEQFKSDMNLTRKEMGELSDMFRQVGLQGVMSFSQIRDIAESIKNTYGELDTSMLKQAVNLVKDLPKEQIDVMIKGHGSLDDTGNLIANLLESGKIQVAAEMITKGAFGQVQGLTVQMSEADREQIKTQKYIASSMDKIESELTGFIPGFAQSAAQWSVQIAGIGVSLGRVAYDSMVAAKTLGALRNSAAMNPTAIPVTSNTTSTPGNSGLNMGSLKKTLITAAVTAVATWASTKLIEMGNESKRQETARYRQESRKSVKDYGYDFTNNNNDKYISNYKAAGTGMVVGTTIATIGAGVAAIAGAKIGGVLGAWAGPIGVAIGAAVGALGGLTYALIANTKEDLFASREEKLANRLQKENIKLAKQRIKLEKRSRGGDVDERKSIVNLARYSKAMEMISNGAYSQKNRTMAKSALNNIEMMSMIGGNRADFSANVSRAVTSSTDALVTDINHYREITNKLLNDENISQEAKNVALAKYKDKELELYEKYNNALMKSIAQYEKIPEIIIANLRGTLNANLMQRRAKQFVGTAGTEAVVAKGVGQNAVEQTNIANQQSSEEIIKVRENIDKLTEVLKNNIKQMESTQRQLIELGVSGIKLNNGDNGTLGKNSKTVEKEISAFESQIREKSKNSGIAERQAFKSLIDEQSNNIIKAREKARDDKNFDKTKYQEEFGKLISSSIQQLDSIIKDETGTYSDAEKERAVKAKAELELQSKKLDKNTSSADFQNLANLLNQQMMALSQIISIQNLRKTGAKEEDIKRYQKMLEYRSRASNYQGVTDEKVLNEQAMNQIITKSFEEYDKAVRYFQDACDTIYEGAQNLYADLMKTIAQNSQRYNSTLYGGISSQLKLTQEEGRSIEAQKNAIDSLQNIIPQLQSQLNKGWEQSIKDFKPQEQQYLQMLKDLSDARYASMLNPDDEEAKKRIQVLTEQLNKFAALNAQAISKMEENPAFKQVKTRIGQFSESIGDLAKKTSEYKNIFAQFFEAFEKRIDDSINLDFTHRLYESTKRSASAGVTVAGYHVNANEIKAEGNKNIEAATRQGMLDVKNTQLAVMADIAKQQELLNKARQSGNIDDIVFAQRELVNTRKLGEAKIKQAIIKNHQEIAKAIKQKYNELSEIIKRKSDMLETQMDVANIVGAPFEHILELEQRRVDIARQELELAEKQLEQTRARFGQGKETEQAKLKVAQKQAEVIKKAWGVQRDSLDKMLGKVMGTFQEIGGIFGPNGARMQARKYGQGYATTPGGQIERAMDGYSGRQNVMHGRMRGEGYFATGGEIPGNSRSGDKVMAFVNSGEWVLNPQQMNKLASVLGVENAEDVFNVSNGRGFAQGGQVNSKKFKKMSMSVKQARAGNFDRSEDWMTDEEQAENEKAKNNLKGTQKSADKSGSGADGVQNSRGKSIDLKTGVAKRTSSRDDIGDDYVKKIYQNTSEMLSLAKGDSKDGKKGTEKEEKYLAEMTKKLEQAKAKGDSAGIAAAENDVADAKFRLLEKQQQMKPRWGEVIDYERQILQTLRAQNSVTSAFERERSKYATTSAIPSQYKPSMGYIPNIQYSNKQTEFDKQHEHEIKATIYKQQGNNFKNFNRLNSSPLSLYRYGKNFLKNHPIKSVLSSFRNAGNYLRHPIQSIKNVYNNWKNANYGGGGYNNTDVVKIKRITPKTSIQKPVASSIKQFKMIKGGRLVPQLTVPTKTPVGTSLPTQYGGGGYNNTNVIKIKKIPLNMSNANKGIQNASKMMKFFSKFKNITVSPKLLSFASKAGKVAGIVGVAATVYDAYTTHKTAQSLNAAGYERDAEKEYYKFGGRTAGGLAGGFGGAKLGAAIGTMIAPGIGTIIGGLIGGVAGGLIGSSLGESAGSGLHNKFSTKTNSTEENAKQASSDYIAQSNKRWANFAKQSGVFGTGINNLFASEDEYNNLMRKYKYQGQHRTRIKQRQRLDEYLKGNPSDEDAGRFMDMQEITFKAQARGERDKLMEKEIGKRTDSLNAVINQANKNLSIFSGSLARTNEMYKQQIQEMQKSFEGRQKERKKQLQSLSQQYSNAKTDKERRSILARAQALGEEDERDRQKTALNQANKARQAEREAERLFLVKWKHNGQQHQTLMTKREAEAKREKLEQAGVAKDAISVKEVQARQRIGANGQLEAEIMHLLQNENGEKQWFTGKAYQDAIKNGWERVIDEKSGKYVMQQGWAEVNRDKWKSGNIDYSQSQGGRFRNVWSDADNRAVRLDLQDEQGLKEYDRLMKLQLNQFSPKQIENAYESYIKELTAPQQEQIAKIDRLLQANPNSFDADSLKAKRKQLEDSIAETRRQVDAREQFGVMFGNDDGKAYLPGTKEYEDAKARNRNGFRIGQKYDSVEDNTVSVVGINVPGKGKATSVTKGAKQEQEQGSGITPPSADTKGGFTKSASARSVARRNAGIDFSKPNPNAQEKGSVKADAQTRFESSVQKFNQGVSNFTTAITNYLEEQARGRIKDESDTPNAKSADKTASNDGDTSVTGETNLLIVDGKGNKETLTTNPDAAIPPTNPNMVTSQSTMTNNNGNLSATNVTNTTSQLSESAQQATNAINVAFQPAQVTVNLKFDNNMFKEEVKKVIMDLAAQTVNNGMNKSGGQPTLSK